MVAAKLYKYYAVACVHAKERWLYFANVISELPIIMLRLWIFKQFYGVTYAMTQTKEFDGLNLSQMLWSLMIIQCFSASSPTISKKIDLEIKSGSFAYMINKPYSYMGYHYMGFLGNAFPSLVITLLGGSIVMLLLIGPIAMTWQAMVGGLLAMVLGMSLNFFIEFAIGLLALWIEDTSSITWIYHKAIGIFGGAIISLALFPTQLKRIVELLPFSVLYSSAAQLMVHFSTGKFVFFIVMQLFWLLVFGSLAFVLWQRGMRNVSISGG